MTARATWKGVLKISAVHISIKVYPATESTGSISFNQLHSECQTRMQQKRWCPTCACEVASKDIVKGFEFEKDRYVILNEHELDAVQPDSTKVIDLTRFADVSAFDPLYIDRSYYLAPDGGPAGEAYAVIGEAMLGRVGIGKLAIYGREYLVAVRPLLGSLLMLHTLHHAAEIRPIDGIEDLRDRTRATSAAQVNLARHVMAAFTGPLNLTAFTDEYQRDIRQLIDAKIAGAEIVVALPVETAPILTLRAALEQSLAAVSAAKKTPAKVATTPKRKRA